MSCRTVTNGRIDADARQDMIQELLSVQRQGESRLFTFFRVLKISPENVPLHEQAQAVTECA